jgi:hypothetical protein
LINVHVAENVLAIKQGFTLNTLSRIEVVHAIQNTEQRGLAAARRPHKSSHSLVVDRYRHVAKCLVAVFIEKVETADTDFLCRQFALRLATDYVGDSLSGGILTRRRASQEWKFRFSCG